MPCFRCIIRGENFPGQLIGETRPVGFYVTRFVQSADSDSVEADSLRELRVDPKLATPLGFTPTGEARIFFEEIAQVDAGEVSATQTGFAWYPMDEIDDA